MITDTEGPPHTHTNAFVSDHEELLLKGWGVGVGVGVGGSELIHTRQGRKEEREMPVVK